MEKTLCWVLVGLLLVGVVAEKECLCPKLAEGQWSLRFSHPVVNGLRLNGKVGLKHLYNEIYYGTVVIPSIIPFANFRMDFMGYLNGTSCHFRGSIAHVLQRVSVVYKLKYDGMNHMEGRYHRTTAVSIDDHFSTLKMDLEKTTLDNDLQAAMDAAEATKTANSIPLTT